MSYSVDNEKFATSVLGLSDEHRCLWDDEFSLNGMANKAPLSVVKSYQSLLQRQKRYLFKYKDHESKPEAWLPRVMLAQTLSRHIVELLESVIFTGTVMPWDPDYVEPKEEESEVGVEVERVEPKKDLSPTPKKKPSPASRKRKASAQLQRATNLNKKKRSALLKAAVEAGSK